MYCNNCGEKGHYSRQCDKPITSYGVLLFTYEKDIPRMVMIQRKDSLCYIELIRGKYNPKDTKLIKLLLSRISNIERQNMMTKDFNTLWKDLWLINDINETNYMKEYNRSKKLFNMLKEGYSINNNIYSMNNYFKDIQDKYSDTEWEFPKGKKKPGETFLEAAERELQEESGIKKGDYNIIKNIHQIQETFTGENNVNYKNIYYVGYCHNTDNLKIDKQNIEQMNEIKDISIKTKEECLSCIRDYNTSKVELIDMIYRFIDNYKTDFTLE